MICKPCSTTVIFLAVLAPILSFLVSGGNFTSTFLQVLFCWPWSFLTPDSPFSPSSDPGTEFEIPAQEIAPADSQSREETGIWLDLVTLSPNWFLSTHVFFRATWWLTVMGACFSTHHYLTLETGNIFNVFLLKVKMINNLLSLCILFSALSVVWRQKVNVRNNGIGEKAIDILSISGSSLHFHCSFVADKVK